MRQPGWVHWSSLVGLSLALGPLGCGDTQKNAHPATPDNFAGTSSGGKANQGGSASQSGGKASGGSATSTGGSGSEATDLDTFLEE